jgi:hypothetical protein
MCEDGSYPNVIRLNLELSILFARIKNEPIIGRILDLSHQLQDVLEDRLIVGQSDPE